MPPDSLFCAVHGFASSQNLTPSYSGDSRRVRLNNTSSDFTDSSVDHTGSISLGLAFLQQCQALCHSVLDSGLGQIDFDFRLGLSGRSGFWSGLLGNGLGHDKLPKVRL